MGQISRIFIAGIEGKVSPSRCDKGKILSGKEIEKLHWLVRGREPCAKIGGWFVERGKDVERGKKE